MAAACRNARDDRIQRRHRPRRRTARRYDARPSEGNISRIHGAVCAPRACAHAGHGAHERETAVEAATRPSVAKRHRHSQKNLKLEHALLDFTRGHFYSGLTPLAIWDPPTEMGP